MSFTVADFHDLVRLVEERPEWRAELRRLVLTEELLALPDQVARLRSDTEHGFQQLTAQMAGLTAAQARTEEQMKALSQAQSRTEEELRWIANWQRGEAGRRDGERYERETLRRAPALFNGGQGGSLEQPDIQQRLTTLLASLLAGEILHAEDDPFLADLIWWKGEKVAVVEVSLQVDRQDVSRAERRANTLKHGGLQAIAIVIGEQWATSEAREQAQVRQVEWKIDVDLSEGFLSFRRQ
jgi:hypothetical protein